MVSRSKKKAGRVRCDYQVSPTFSACGNKVRTFYGPPDNCSMDHKLVYFVYYLARCRRHLPMRGHSYVIIDVNTYIVGKMMID